MKFRKVEIMAKYLLDTNILIYLINHNPKSVEEKIKTLKIGALSTCSIVVSELYFGVEKSKYKEQNQKALETILKSLVIYDFGIKEAKEYAKLRFELEQAKSLIGNMDMLIASCARANHLILVTNNEKEFTRIKGLKIENWA